MISRRTFLKGSALFAGALAVNGVAMEPRMCNVERVDVALAAGEGLNGFTICQITDVHHSWFVSIDYVKQVVETANSLSPDLTVLTGDYIDEGRKYMAPAIKALSSLKARFGVISILGNHDHFIGKDYTMDVLSSYRLPLLENSNKVIEVNGSALCVAGTKDYIEDAPDAGAALAGVPDDVPRVLLSHHPDYAEEIPEDLRVDLILSGHTHGGQVRIPYSIAPIVPSRYGQKYSGGLVRLKKGRQVYVSRGIGVVMIPVRFNCPPELTLLTLKADTI